MRKRRIEGVIVVPTERLNMGKEEDELRKRKEKKNVSFGKREHKRKGKDSKWIEKRKKNQ
jgi:hypothetical protein